MIVGQSSVPYLKQLGDDLNPFTPDQIDDVMRYVENTGLQTGLIQVIADVRMILIDENNKDLRRKYDIIRKDLMGHVARRIQRITHPDSSSPTDPWYDLQVRAEDVDLKCNCAKASSHIEDVLFDSEELVKSGLMRAHERVAGEVKELLSCLTKDYLPTLKQNSAQDKEVQEELTKMGKSLTDSMEGLHTALHEKRYPETGKIVTDIKELLLKPGLCEKPLVERKKGQ